ncbi:hypothetical protein [Streptomyces sp. CS014]|uniref:hypothetical protein n=1 Tax=Streptomyces sp. CS014 TaxID=2162707 RepID=UPI000D51BABA|nr:hypothetical protein [Streptomyces sp. CS014]PVC81996.1 hypothetical protein DBP12_36410 [Streptomyces sp. CS014]
MNGQQAASAGTDEVLVGRCYTKARRLPLVMGELSGFRLWGGPYSVTQLVTMVIVLGLMMLLHPLWAHYGLLNAALLIGVPFAAAFLVRYLPTEGRNPLMVLGGAAGVLTAGQGRIAGRPLRRRHRQVPVLGTCTVAWRPDVAPCTAAAAGLSPARGSRAARPADGVATPVRAAGEAAPALAGGVVAPVRVLSGVGALLAARDGAPAAKESGSLRNKVG